jgi:hypothetical protein
VSDLDRLLAKVGAKARAEGGMPPVATQSQIISAERSIGFALPRFLVALYERVANGGFGPGRSVTIPGYNAAVLHPVEKLAEWYHSNTAIDETTPYTPWPRGVVPMLYWGHFGEAAVDCLDPAAPVLRYESDLDAEGLDGAWKLDEPTIERWWEAWADGLLKKPTQAWPGSRA